MKYIWFYNVYILTVKSFIPSDKKYKQYYNNQFGSYTVTAIGITIARTYNY